jgi:hypothetical protein
MTVAQDVVALFGGVAATAKALGHKNPTTVQGWINRGVIPVRQLRAVIRAAREQGRTLTLEDLVPDDLQN